MGYLVGLLIGGLIGVYLLYSLLHWAIFKRVTPDPMVGNMLAVVTAYPVGSVIYGFASAPSFTTAGFINYLIPSGIVAALAFKRGRDKGNEDGLSIVFE